jgi:ribosome-binding factor A
MAHRIPKVNKRIQRIFGEILQTKADLPPDVLVTVARVETAANLHSTTIWLYIFPLEQGEVTIAQLKQQLYDLQGIFNRTINTYPLPRITLKVDYGAQQAETIERRLKELDEKFQPTSSGEK